MLGAYYYDSRPEENNRAGVPFYNSAGRLKMRLDTVSLTTFPEDYSQY